MHLSKHLRIVVAATALALVPGAAGAAEARADARLDAKADGRPDARPDGWQTWTWQGNCFAFDYAKGPSIDGVQNGDTYIAVKHLPREKNYDNVSVVSGFGDITGSQGTLEIGGQEFPLLVYGNAGFVRSGEPEHKVMELLSRSSEATVTWYRKDGMAVQNYDITNFAAAKRTIDTACPHAAAAVAATDARDGDKDGKADEAEPAHRRKRR